VRENIKGELLRLKYEMILTRNYREALENLKNCSFTQNVFGYNTLLRSDALTIVQHC
jgi:hypothetical protein